MKLVLLLLSFHLLFSQDTINQFDADGNKHGLWKGYYEDTKRLRYQGTFEHGIEVGEFVFYDNTKANTVIGKRQFNKDGSVYNTIYKGKFKVSEGAYINKLKDGSWKYYHFESDQVMVIENYKNDKREGKRTVFYADGDLLEESYYKNDVLHGTYKKYAQTNEVLEELNYAEGKLNGKAIFRDHKGNVESEGYYKNDIAVGEWIYYENGKEVRRENKADVYKARKPGDKGSHPSAEKRALKKKPKS